MNTVFTPRIQGSFLKPSANYGGISGESPGSRSLKGTGQAAGGGKDAAATARFSFSTSTKSTLRTALSGVTSVRSLAKSSCVSAGRTQKTFTGGSGVTGGTVISGNKNENTSGKTAKTQDIQDKLQGLKTAAKKKEKTFTGYSKDYENGFFSVSNSREEEEEDLLPKPSTYNYKEVANKILRAKTSVSASQAVLAAKRKVIEMKRKISAGDGNEEELQMALTHAKKMEMVARKKKHHLELEELAEHTRVRDEELSRQQEAVNDLKNSVISAEEEELSEAEDEIFEEREAMMEEASEELRESGIEDTKEMLTSLNQEIAEFGEEELKELEEAMEMLEDMEVIDPHMSEEDLEELKRKHRIAENKAIMKADMDYLKGMIKHMVEKGTSMPSGGFSGSAAFSAAFAAGTSIAVTSAPIAASVDVQV